MFIRTKNVVILLSLLLIAVVTLPAYSFVPEQINYQGFLTDSDGNPVSDDDYDMLFAIYDAPAGGTLLWGESQTVTVTNGIYNVILGQPGNFIDPDIIDGDRYLGVTVGTDAEMTPRQKLTATAFTLKAAKAEDAATLDGKDSTELDQSAHVGETNNPHGVTAAQTGAAAMSDITWGNLSNIPSGFADGEDDAGGITTELDPTVLASVKNGVSWSELSGIPSGFSDGMDNVGGMTTSEDYGRSGVASDLYEGSQHLTNRYINDDRAETIQADTESNLLRVIQDGGGYAIEAKSNGSIGVYSEAKSPSGAGVAGYCNYSYGSGVFGQGYSKGVWGYSPTASGYGVYGQAEGRYGTGIYGEVTGNDGIGVHGEATGSNGIGVFGTGLAWAGYFSGGLYASGNVGIGTTTPGHKLQVDGVISAFRTGNAGILQVLHKGSDREWNIYAGYTTDADFSINEGAAYNTPRLTIKSGGNVEINTAGARLITPILEITGGSDLSEQFYIKGFIDKLKPSAGLVVSIDPDSPGDLTVSNNAYDRRVAGIISGAGGVNPGMLMGQKGSKANGETPVALTGRVYCQVDASINPIHPGDLLTTSDTPGHAMKVTDYTKAQGAIIGKAMSSLDAGQGLVLVLVTLQ